MLSLTEKEKLCCLEKDVQACMSEYRWNHTRAVEEMAGRLASLYCPELTYELMAAALLHDITKEFSPEEHYRVLTGHGEDRAEVLFLPMPTLHARSAVYVIRDKYSEFASDCITGAVRYHTTGRAGMTLPEKIIYIADYIDLSRTNDFCITLRNMFWSADPERMDMENRLLHLDACVFMSLDMTIRALERDGKPISRDTVEARNYYLRK